MIENKLRKIFLKTNDKTGIMIKKGIEIQNYSKKVDL